VNCHDKAAAEAEYFAAERDGREREREATSEEMSTLRAELEQARAERDKAKRLGLEHALKLAEGARTIAAAMVLAGAVECDAHKFPIAEGTYKALAKFKRALEGRDEW